MRSPNGTNSGLWQMSSRSRELRHTRKALWLIAASVSFHAGRVSVKLIYDPNKDPDPKPGAEYREVRDSLPASIFFEVADQEVRIKRVQVHMSRLLR